MKTILDNPAQVAAADPGGMLELVRGLPSQLRQAAALAQKLRLSIDRNSIDHVVITGLGGSAIGGDLVRNLAEREAGVPVLVNRGYQVPSFVNERSLVVACSYSGNTEETLSAFERARLERARLVCITSGGKLKALCEQFRVPVVQLPAGPSPRAAIGYTTVPALYALSELGLIRDKTHDLEEAALLLEAKSRQFGPECPVRDNAAKRLAQRWHGKIPILYGSSGGTDVVATRWRSQIEENAKRLAFSHHLPEMNHNEIVGWWLAQKSLAALSVSFLCDRHDHDRLHRRFLLTREIVSRRTDDIMTYETEGESLLARLFSLIYLGDYASVYLAFLNGVDPMPVEAIDYLKERLSKDSS